MAKFPAAHEASDVHPLPNAGEDDDALDFPPVGPSTDGGDAFAEFEDELEADNTRIDDSHLLAEQSTSIIDTTPAQPFLAVEKGNDMGREFVLQQGENGIGRGIDNDVILADVAVSRRHLRVYLEGDRLTLKDLGSGNGSQVNGEKVSQVVLVDGDRIDVGETTLVVRIPGAALPAVDPYSQSHSFDGDGVTDENNIGGTLPPPAFSGTPSNPLSVPHGPGYQPELTPSATNAPNVMRATAAVPRPGAVVLPKPVFLAILAAGALLLAMMGAAVALLAIRSGSDDGGEDTVTLASEGGPFERGVAAYQAHRWDEAEAAFREAAGADEPDPRVGPYLARVGQARQHEQAIVAARQALTAGHANEALSSATSVPDGSPLASQAHEVETQAREQLVRGYVEAGRRAIQQRDAQEARDQLENARNMHPTSDLFRAFETEVQRLGSSDDIAPAPTPPERTPDPPASDEDEDEDEDEPARVVTRRGGASRRRGRSTSAGSSSSGERTAITAYLAGRFDQAATAARTAASGASARDRSRLERMASDITQFGQIWGRVGRVTSPSPSQRRDMERAIHLDGRIARNTQYRDQLRDRVVTGYLSEARARRSDPVASCGSVRSALGLQPSNAQARQMAADCETRARSTLAAARNAPPARRVAIYRQVIGMVPPASPSAQEAQRLMAAARRQTTDDEDE